MQRLGFTAIDVYIPWNQHERHDGGWGFTGEKDAAHFLICAPTRGCWSSPDGVGIPFDAQLAWPSVATFANLPATSAPIGLSAGGLPLAVQVIGPHLGDLTTIAFAGMVAREIPGAARGMRSASGRYAAESAAPPPGGKTPVDVSRAADALRRPPRESEDQAARKRR